MPVARARTRGVDGDHEEPGGGAVHEPASPPAVHTDPAHEASARLDGGDLTHRDGGAKRPPHAHAQGVVVELDARECGAHAQSRQQGAQRPVAEAERSRRWHGGASVPCGDPGERVGADRRA